MRGSTPSHQRLHRPGDARAPPDGEPSGAAGRRVRPHPTTCSTIADRDHSTAGSAGFRPNSGRSSCSTTTWATRRPRSPRRSASHRGTARYDSITHIAPCGPPSRRTPEPPSRKVARHEPTSRHRTPPGSLVRRRVVLAPRSGHRHRRRPHRSATPATRVAVPREGTPHDLHPQARRRVRRGAGPRRRRVQPVAGRPPGDRRSAGQPEPDNGPALVQSRCDHPARHPAFACRGDAYLCEGPLDPGEHTSVDTDFGLSFTVPAGWSNTVGQG